MSDLRTVLVGAENNAQAGSRNAAAHAVRR